MKDDLDFEGYTCPVPIQPKDMVMLGHGSGGKLSHDLIEASSCPGWERLPRARWMTPLS